jgi:lysyl-tRNA synthetase class 2
MLYNPFSPADQRLRATVLQKIRQFFAERNVLEVDTPLLAEAPVTDPYIQAVQATCMGKTYYLQTSPEYAMKRLLAAGSGSIYQICKAFRDEEQSKIHRAEFTMLEWYRVALDDRQLMDETDALIQLVTGFGSAKRFSYQQLFERYVEINPHQESIERLEALVHQHMGEIVGLRHPTREDYLQLLMLQLIEPELAKLDVVIIYDYPASQAALAKKQEVDGQLVAKRFEVYCRGVELANAYYELTDAKEQRRRFEADLLRRQQMNLPTVPIDEPLLAAMEKGLPECAGIALGLDRLLLFCHPN